MEKMQIRAFRERGGLWNGEGEEKGEKERKIRKKRWEGHVSVTEERILFKANLNVAGDGALIGASSSISAISTLFIFRRWIFIRRLFLCFGGICGPVSSYLGSVSNSNCHLTTRLSLVSLSTPTRLNWNINKLMFSFFKIAVNLCS